MLRFDWTSDETVVRRVLNGRRDEFAVLVRRYVTAARAVAAARVETSDIDDVVQESFLRAFQHLDTLREQNRFGAWLLTIVRNTATRMLSRQLREKEIVGELGAAQAAAAPNMERRELLETLRHQIMRLDPDPRELLLLRYFAGKSVREIAALLQVTPDTVKMRLRRAVDLLGKQLARRIEEAGKPEEKRVRELMAIIGGMPVAWKGAAEGGGIGAMGGSTVGVPTMMKVAATAGVLLSALLVTYVAFKPAAPRNATSAPPTATVPSETPAPAADLSAAPEAGALAPPPAGSGVPQLGSISGVVVDTSGGPLAGARVGIYREEAEERDANASFRPHDWTVVSTDSKGAFVLPDLVPGAYVASFTPPGEAGYLPGYANSSNERRLFLREGEHLRNLKWVFGEGNILWGRVTDPEGNPIPEAIVQVDKATEPKLNVSARSQDDGSYVVEGLPQGDYFLSVVAARTGYVNSPIDHRVAPGTERNFVLAPRPVIRGQVLRADTGKPVVDFGIFAGETPADPAFEGNGLTDGLCQPVHDEEGRFEIAAASSGDTTVWVNAPGFMPGCERLAGLAPGETVQNVVIRLARSVPLSGFVTDSAGKPVGGATVFIGYPKLWLSRGELRPKESGATASAMEDGSFGLAQWPPELARVSAYCPGYAPGMTEIVGDPVKAQPLVIVLAKGGSLRGNVTLDGRPLGKGQATVSAKFPGANETLGAVSVTTVGTGGAYRLEAIPPGRILVQCFLAYEFLPPGTDYWLEKDMDVADASTDETAFSFVSSHGSAVEGDIRCSAGPLGGPILTLYADGPDGSRACYSGRVDPSGHYRVDGLPAGTLRGRLRATVPGSPTLDQDFTVEIEPGRTALHDIDVEP